MPETSPIGDNQKYLLASPNVLLGRRSFIVENHTALVDSYLHIVFFF
jgi:hypothetical protein